MRGTNISICVPAPYCGKLVGEGWMREALSGPGAYLRAAGRVLKENERAIRFCRRRGFRFAGREEPLRPGIPVTEVRTVLSSARAGEGTGLRAPVGTGRENE